MTKKRLQIGAVAIACLLAVAALSSPGRSAIGRFFPTLVGSRAATEATATAQVVTDYESRARVRHGWNAGVLNSVMRGTVTFYDRDGTNMGQSMMVLYRAYPSRLRVELTRGGNTEVSGFDSSNTWRSGESNPGEGRARDIRQWLRVCPERLFMTRTLGASYREAGSRVELSKPGQPWQGPSRIMPPAHYEVVEMEDTIGAPPIAGRSGDRRRVAYYINRQDYTIETARWLEPDDPRRGIDESPSLTDVRVDFSDWQRVGGVLWPREIVHWQGGRVDYRIAFTQVQMNQSLADSMFQRP